MDNFRSIGFLLIVILFLNVSLHAGLFDDRYPSARVTGMGGASVAISHDLWASYYNPAGLSYVTNIQLGASYNRMFNLNFFKNYFAAGAYPLPERFGTLSFSLQYFGVEYEGNQLSSEYTFALSHGFFLLKDIQSSLAVGYTLKAYYWNLGNSVEGVDLGSSVTPGIDVGLQASVWGRTYVGLYFLNLNAPSVGAFEKHELPQRVVAGIAYQPYEGVTTTLDLNRLIGIGENEIWGGAEFKVFNILFLRFGGTTNPNRFTFGVGFEINHLNVDYGMRTHSELGETHQFEVRYQF